MHGLGLKIRKERADFGGGGVIPKGVEVKRARVSICNSNEDCLQ